MNAWLKKMQSSDTPFRKNHNDFSLCNNNAIVEQSRKKMRRVILTSLLCLVLFACLLTAERLYYQSNSGHAYENIRVSRSIGDAVLLEDEILTSSAQLAAATGDKEWVDRYNLHLPHISEAIFSARAIAPEAIWELFVSSTGQANETLISIEKKILQSVTEGNLEDAQRLVASKEYIQQKEILSAGTRQFVSDFQNAAQAELTALQTLSFRIQTITLLLVVAFIGLLWWSLRSSLRQSWKNTEKALNQLNFHEIALNEHAIVATLDIKGTIIEVNEKLCQITGYGREELVGQNIRVINSSYHHRSFFEEMIRLIRSGNTWHGEIRNRAKDGSFYWVDSTVTPIINTHGEVARYVAIENDITDRKTAESVLQTNIDILNTTFDNFPGGISLVSKDLVMQAVNPAFYRLLDLPEDKFPAGSRYEDVIRYNAERGEYGECDVEEFVAATVEKALKFEEHAFKRVRPGGISLDVKGWPLPEGGFITTYMDITEAENLLTSLEQQSNEATKMAEDLRRAQDIQNQTHQHLLSSVNSMRNGFVIWDADDRMILANETYREFNDPIRGQITEGTSYKDILLAGCEAGIFDFCGTSQEEWVRRQTLERRQSKYVERDLALKDGRQVVVADHVLNNGEIITTVVDVTTHRERELELQDTKKQLENIAYFDSLTGLANRAHCQKDMVEKFTFNESDKKFAIIQIDLDNFKRVNDTLGHAAGDFLLSKIGERMTQFAEEYDNFRPYRWGGDEFIALVERNARTDLKGICETLTALTAKPVEYGNTTLRPTVSLGVARYPEDAEDIESLMIFSDLALYKTKELGRDGYQFFTSEMKENIDAEIRIEHALREALENDELELYFQPQVNIDDEAITGVEALIRWNHPEKGILGPGEFLATSEAAGMARDVGRRVFDLAMKAAQHWSRNDLKFGRLSINLSPQHLKKSTILDDFFSAMDKYQVAPEVLGVEFLESFVFDDSNANVIDTLRQFNDSGVHVELDDFGTGYASLSHLSTMPIDGLKIDRSFIKRMSDDLRHQGIVASLVSMSKLLKLRVVCEGIETRDQVDTISSIGNCSIQGYFIARPMSFDDATIWIAEQRNVGVFQTARDVAVLG